MGVLLVNSKSLLDFTSFCYACYTVCPYNKVYDTCVFAFEHSHSVCEHPGLVCEQAHLVCKTLNVPVHRPSGSVCRRNVVVDRPNVFVRSPNMAFALQIGIHEGCTLNWLLLIISVRNSVINLRCITDWDQSFWQQKCTDWPSLLQTFMSTWWKWNLVDINLTLLAISDIIKDHAHLH